ncbi:YfiR family protein [Fulvivirga lutea]|uniref:YfiR family protein n=1 Tax=Fulvivirga lutea TaxID=2810512 RepID=A0A974WG99_9BACT|nr:YfiR family protein [Fulvivirga lutea]QSE96607.1 YfiR family protein [Fulvivirga lutea]
MLKVGFSKWIITALLSLGAVVASAQSYQLHTVYIYSFIRYIQWPAPLNEGDFTIGVLGDSPIIEHLEKMAASKKAGARSIVIKKFNGTGDVSGTNILFISKSASEMLTEVKAKALSNNTLIISEKEGLGMEGSGINFVERNGKLAFELNKSSVDEAQLKVSSELSRLAIVI